MLHIDVGGAHYFVTKEAEQLPMIRHLDFCHFQTGAGGQGHGNLVFVQMQEQALSTLQEFQVPESLTAKHREEAMKLGSSNRQVQVSNSDFGHELFGGSQNAHTNIMWVRFPEEFSDVSNDALIDWFGI